MSDKLRVGNRSREVEAEELATLISTMAIRSGGGAGLSSHEVTGIFHTVSGLTAGDLLEATASNDFGWVAPSNAPGLTAKVLKTTAAGVIQANVNGIFNVRAYGATGDGVTDDTAAIQAAITAAVAVNGMVYIPHGNYLLDGTGDYLLTINDQIRLTGAGWGSVLLVDPSVGSSTDVIRVYGPSEGVVIEQLKIAPASGTPARNGINLNATSTYAGERPISKFVISHVWIAQLGAAGIATTFPAPYVDGIFNGVIRESFIYGGIDLERAGDSLTIRDNLIAGTGPGIHVNLIREAATSANQLCIDHNTFIAANGSIILENGQHVKIIHNYFEPAAGSTPSPNATLVDLQGTVTYPVENTIIFGNQFNGTPNTTTYHIRCDYARGIFIDDNSFQYGTALQRAIQTTANAEDVFVGPNVHGPYATALSYLFETAGAQVTTHLPRYGAHRIGPNVNIINDTGSASEDAFLTITETAAQVTTPILIQDSSSNPLFRIGATGAVILSLNRQINAVDSGAAIVPILDANAGGGIDTVRIGHLSAASGTSYLLFYIDGAEKARFSPDANLLIGTTTDGMTAAGSLAIAQDLAHRGTKVGFFNTTPIVKAANTVALDTLLVNYGLRTTGGYANFDTTILPRVGTAAANTAPLKLTAGTLLTTPEAGALEFDGTGIYLTPTNHRRFISLASDSIIATVTATTVASTTLWTGIINANELKAQRVYHIWGCGAYTTHDANDQATMVLDFGGTTVATLLTPMGIVTNEPYHFEIVVTVRTVGEAGTLSSHGHFISSAGDVDTNIESFAINTTLASTATVKVTWSDTLNSMSLHQCWMATAD